MSEPLSPSLQLGPGQHPQMSHYLLVLWEERKMIQYYLMYYVSFFAKISLNYHILYNIKTKVRQERIPKYANRGTQPHFYEALESGHSSLLVV